MTAKLDELGWSPSEMVTMAGMYMDRTAYNIKKSVRDWFRELLEILFQAAGLIIDTLRTFFLIVLSILGPLAFAISVYDGFQSTLTQWISRYISIYLWLPVSDLFSSVLARIQTLMLQKDIEQLSDPNFIPDGSSTIYVNLYDNRHRGLLHHPHSGKLDFVGWRHVRLQPQRGKSRVGRRGGGWSDKREDCRETTQITNFNLSEHGI